MKYKNNLPGFSGEASIRKSKGLHRISSASANDLNRVIMQQVKGGKGDVLIYNGPMWECNNVCYYNFWTLSFTCGVECDGDHVGLS